MEASIQKGTQYLGVLLKKKGGGDLERLTSCKNASGIPWVNVVT